MNSRSPPYSFNKSLSWLSLSLGIPFLAVHFLPPLSEHKTVVETTVPNKLMEISPHTYALTCCETTIIYVFTVASFPGLCPASCHLQYGEAREGTAFPHMSDITDRTNYPNVGVM